MMDKSADCASEAFAETVISVKHYGFHAQPANTVAIKTSSSYTARVRKEESSEDVSAAVQQVSP